MSTQTNFETLKVFEDTIKDLLLYNKKVDLSKSSINRTIRYIKTSNYLQILYSYGIDVLSILLNHFLEEEDYEKCAKIRDCVYNHNKATGEQLKLEI